MRQLFILFLSIAFSYLGFAQNVSPGVIFWNQARTVSLSDFIVVSDTSSKIAGDHMAVTRTGITYSLTTKPGSKNFEITIYATMHKPNSFIRERVLDAPKGSINYLMNHEQKHFDISEIYAREAVKAIRGKRFTKNYTREINDLMKGLFKQSEDLHDLYDNETGNGTNASAQSEWNNRIQRRLNGLDAYKNKTIAMRVY